MRKKDKKPKPEEIKFQQCKIEGCSEHAGFPAPSRKQLPKKDEIEEIPLERDWYCQEHIREFNEKWNFFAGMSEEEILKFQKDSVIGHRITMPNSKRVASISKKIEMAARKFRMGEDMAKENQDNHMGLAPQRIKKHLLVLELPYPFNMEDLKKNYRDLAKKHHPDVNTDDSSVEMFAKIKDAYETLRQYLEAQDF